MSERLEVTIAELRAQVARLQQANDDLREENRRLGLAWEIARGGVFELSVVPDASTYVSEQWARMLGLAVEELPAPERFGDWLEERMHSEDRLARRRTYGDFLAGRSARHQMDLRIRHQDGRWIWVRAVMSALERAADGSARHVLGVMIDSSDLKNAAQALRESEERLRLAKEAAGLGIFDDDIASGRLGWDARTRELWGIGATEPVTFDTFLAGVHPEDRESAQAAVRRALDPRGDGTYQIEYRVVNRADGTQRWIAATGQARFSNGRVSRFLGTVQDITERKRAEAARRGSEARFRLAIEGSAVSVYENDQALRYTWIANPPCQLDASEMIGKCDADLLAPAQADALLAFKREVLATGQRMRRQLSLELGGRTCVLDLDAEPAWHEDGRLLGIRVAATDITSVHEAQQALRASEERFRTLADHIAQLAWMADGDGGIFWYNKRWFDYTGRTLEEMRGWGWRSVHHPDHLERVVEKVRHCFETGAVWEDTFPLLGADGRYRWFLSRALPIRDASGRVTCWFGTNTDITEQREAEERLRAADRRKDEFLAMLSHELRNPLAVIQNTAELIALTPSEDPRLRRASTIFQRQLAQMSALVDGLLEVSRITRGKIALHRQTLDLRDVLEAVIQDRALGMARQGLVLRKTWPREPVFVDGDPVRLNQVFSNLIGNAIKFTPAPGTIGVTLRIDQGTALVRVRDTGMGIRPEMLTSIFEPFQQDSGTGASAAGGLGLGLALAKGLVELHQGSIHARSRGPGTGAELSVRLPLAAAAPLPRAALMRARTSPRRILIVEDNRDLAQSLLDLLELLGHVVDIAEDGASALNVLRERLVDLVLCDIGLPDMSGYALARAIRAEGALSGGILCAVTGYGRAEDRQQALDAGFDAHLTKPISVKVLQEVIARLGSLDPLPGGFLQLDAPPSPAAP